MKSQIASIELAALIKELNKLLIGAKIEKIYLIPDKELIIQLHIPNTGKRVLRINCPKYMYLSETKPETPQTPHGFCQFLRKRLKNARIRSIQQLDFERIFEIEFSTKDHNYKLIVEMFSKGNILLTDTEYQIISPLEIQKWKDRTIRAKTEYIYPKQKYNILKLTENQLKTLFKESKKESVVKTLALDLNLGGVYAEELCLKAKIDKNKKTATPQMISKIFAAIKELRKLKISPHIIKNKDIVPFELEFYKDKESTKTKSYNQAFDQIFTKKETEKVLTDTKSKHEKEIEKLNKIIKKQQKQVDNLKKQYKDNTEKGEIIYNNYPQIKDILEQLNIVRKQMTWKELKAKLKNHKVIKKVNEKNSEIILKI